jgi:hypothetical protein
MVDDQRRIAKKRQSRRACRGGHLGGAGHELEDRNLGSRLRPGYGRVCTENFKPERSGDEVHPKGRVNL